MRLVVFRVESAENTVMLNAYAFAKMTHKAMLEGKSAGAQFVIIEPSGPKQYLLRFNKKV